MSTIDEIMGAIGRHGDDCIRDADAASASFEALRELIAAALAAKDAEIERLKAQLAEPANPVPGEWIEWAGGQQPVPDGVLCQTRLEDGDEDARLAENWVWEHDEFGANIVAYRVLP